MFIIFYIIYLYHIGDAIAMLVLFKVSFAICANDRMVRGSGSICVFDNFVFDTAANLFLLHHFVL
jgi:hypothetical protein